MTLLIESRCEGDFAYVYPDGQVDSHSLEDIRQHIMQVLDDRQFNLVLNLRSVNFIDSSGLGLIVNLHKMATGRRGRLVVSNVPESIHKVILSTRLDTILNVVADEAQAAPAPA